MTDLMKKLKNYGVNIPEIMERFVDDEELYEQCLNDFMKDEAFGKLEQTLSAKEYSAAFDQAHTLKGVAGNLGLTPLFVAISNLVEPLRNNVYDNLDSLYAILVDEKQKVDQLIENS